MCLNIVDKNKQLLLVKFHLPKNESNMIGPLI